MGVSLVDMARERDGVAECGGLTCVDNCTSVDTVILPTVTAIGKPTTSAIDRATRAAGKDRDDLTVDRIGVPRFSLVGFAID
jgi:hypothetical protein